jgi:hypothetical protein
LSFDFVEGNEADGCWKASQVTPNTAAMASTAFHVGIARAALEAPK